VLCARAEDKSPNAPARATAKTAKRQHPNRMLIPLSRNVPEPPCVPLRNPSEHRRACRFKTVPTTPFWIPDQVRDDVAGMMFRKFPPGNRPVDKSTLALP